MQAQNLPPEFKECLGPSEFVLVDEEVSFEDAVAGCQGRGGELAVPFSRAENDVLRSLVRGTNSVPNGQGIFLGKISLFVRMNIFSFLLLGLRYIGQGSGGANDPRRFTVLDNFSDDISFFETGGELPWRDSDTPNGQECVT